MLFSGSVEFCEKNDIIKVQNQRNQETNRRYKMGKILDKKSLRISSKRQITIPMKYFKALNLESEVECDFTGEEIILRASRRESGYFAQEILNELIDKGYQGEELKKEFACVTKSVRPAVKKLLKDAHEYSEKFMKDYKDETKDIFGEGD